jgi:hypothetical protein
LERAERCVIVILNWPPMPQLIPWSEAEPQEQYLNNGGRRKTMDHMCSNIGTNLGRINENKQQKSNNTLLINPCCIP